MTPDTSSATTGTPDVRWKRWLRRILLFVSCVCLVLAVITLAYAGLVFAVNRFFGGKSEVAE